MTRLFPIYDDLDVPDCDDPTHNTSYVPDCDDPDAPAWSDRVNHQGHFNIGFPPKHCWLMISRPDKPMMVGFLMWIDRRQNLMWPFSAIVSADGRFLAYGQELVNEKAHWTLLSWQEISESTLEQMVFHDIPEDRDVPRRPEFQYQYR